MLRRLGQIDALIADCLNTPLAPRAAVIHDILRIGIAQLLFLRTPPHAAVATSVDLAHVRGFLSHKGLVNAVLRRLSLEGRGRIERQDAARLNTPDWLWQSWRRAYGEECAHAIAGWSSIASSRGRRRRSTAPTRSSATWRAVGTRGFKVLP